MKYAVGQTVIHVDDKGTDCWDCERFVVWKVKPDENAYLVKRLLTGSVLHVWEHQICEPSG